MFTGDATGSKTRWLRGLDPQRFEALLIRGEASHNWMLLRLSNRSVAFALRRDVMRRCRLIFEVGVVPVVMLGTTAFDLHEVLDATALQWTQHLLSTRDPHAIDSEFVSHLLDVLGIEPATRPHPPANAEGAQAT